jgi:hypothetical protein
MFKIYTKFTFITMIYHKTRIVVMFKVWITSAYVQSKLTDNCTNPSQLKSTTVRDDSIINVLFMREKEAHLSEQKG